MDRGFTFNINYYFLLIYPDLIGSFLILLLFRDFPKLIQIFGITLDYSRKNELLLALEKLSVSLHIAPKFLMNYAKVFEIDSKIAKYITLIKII